MLELFDGIPEVVYAVDPDTYDILYLNDKGKQIFHIGNDLKDKCYRVFQGLDAPCSFCTNTFLKMNKVYTWEYHNPLAGRDYLLKDTLIQWREKAVRFEIAFDVTEHISEKRRLQIALESEKMVMSCIRRLHRESSLQYGVAGLLEQLGRELSAERAYIFQITGQKMSNTYEWCKQGVNPQKDSLQDIEVRLVDRWQDFFSRGECVVIENLEDIRFSSPREYEDLSAQEIKSLVVAPLEQKGRLIGFLGVDNPDAEKVSNISLLLSTLCYFLTDTISRIEGEQALRNSSFTDSLTGIYNRNRYLEDIKYLKKQDGALGVVFLDLNGLKEINDLSGHAQGDKALVACANALDQVFPGEMIYRIGGDEFVAMCFGMEEECFVRKVNELRDQFSEGAEYHIALGTVWSENCRDVEVLLLRSDEEMYEDKRRYYRTHGESRRYRKFEDRQGLTEKNLLLKEYNMLMSSLKVSVSKHLLVNEFSVVWANDCFYHMTGYSKEEYHRLFGDSWKAYYSEEPEEYLRVSNVAMDAFHAGKSGFETLAKIPAKGSGNRWINVVGTFTDEKVDRVPVVYIVFTDVTDFVQMKKEQGITYDNIPGFVAKIQIGEDRPHLLYANKQFKEFFGGFDQERYLQRIAQSLKGNWKVIQDNYETLQKGLPASFEVKMIDSSGSQAYFQVCGDCIDWDQGTPVYLAVFLDITESTLQKAVLQEMAFVDPVTGGRNRTSFGIDASKVVCACPPDTFALVSIDIVKFKLINDMFGIEAGDDTLHYVYKKFEQHIYEDEFVARISSDTFNLLLKMDSPELLEARILSMVMDINSYNEGQENKYIMNMAAGIYIIDAPSMPMTKMQDRANVARKKIKEEAMGSRVCECCYYNDKDSLYLAREKTIENRMRDALKNEEFLVYLQPKVDLKSKKVTGAEALVRWQDPDRGMIFPGEFIPLFERTGFIVDVDLYVFERICKLLNCWKKEGKKPVQISVNMSRKHLKDSNFLKRYEMIRQKYGIEAELLEIELTETMVFENPRLLSKIIEDIKACGYHCSMDDFGSGYSSLNVLKNIRVDTLKLDRAFFSSENLDDPWETAVIGSVIELAKRLQMKTVAEGIETERQAEFLQTVNCDMIQGYLFSRPIPISDFEMLVYGK